MEKIDCRPGYKFERTRSYHTKIFLERLMNDELSLEKLLNQPHLFPAGKVLSKPCKNTRKPVKL